MDALLFRTIDSLVKRGNLRFTAGSGASRSFGDGSGPRVAARFTSPAAQRRVLADPELRLGEAYAEGDLVIEEGTLHDLLDLLLRGMADYRPTFAARALGRLRQVLRRAAQFNPRGRSRRNVAHHYDLTGRLYDLFLDRDRQYSCAYFDGQTDSLELAQLAKKRHIAAKMRMAPGHRVLDIGCGWGGMALYLARMFEARVTGVTLSTEQLEVAQGRASRVPWGQRLDFRLQDYRDVPGPFDRIVSVGMFEHVGVNHYDAFFGKVRELLDADGVMVLHSIGRFDPPGYTNPWIAKYIFPGGYIPALSEVLPAIERAGLVVTDIEILRLHYAETLRHWRERFLARRDEAVALFDERFARMWEFYLVGSELSFRHQGMMVFQIQIARHQEAVPLTRGYIAEEEARLAAIDGDDPAPGIEPAPPLAEAPAEVPAAAPAPRVSAAAGA